MSLSALRLSWLTATILSFWVAIPAIAQRNLSVASAAPNEQRVALVIGNAAYKEPPLRNPAYDATDRAPALRQLGFSVTLRTNAGPRHMQAAIREFSQNLKRGGAGLFTRVLLEEMQQPGVPVDRVLRHVRDEVAHMAKTVGHAQVPALYAQATGEFHFRTGTPVALAAPAAGVPAPAPSDSEASDREFWALVKDSKNPFDIRAYLDQNPNGQFAPLAQAMWVAIAAPRVTVASMARGTVFRDCAYCPEMVVIPAGSFTMGSPASEAARVSDEGPQHQVKISRPFAAGKYEVTRAQYARFVQETGHSTAGGCRVWEWTGDC